MKFIWFHFPSIPFYYLGDFDPFGMDIYLNYLISSEYQIYEKNALPNIQMIYILKQHLNDMERIIQMNTPRLEEFDRKKIELMF